MVSSQVYSLTFIDVKAFKFKQEQKQGIRVSVFDTKTQKYIYIGYFHQPTTTEDRKSLAPLSKNYFPDVIKELTIYYDGNIIIPANFNPDANGYIVRTRVSEESIITVSNTQITESIYYNPPIATTAGATIREELNTFAGSENIGDNFIVNFYVTDSNSSKNLGTSFHDITSNTKENDDERRDIGESATKYTMIGYGYIPLASQTIQNNGLDGVFIRDGDSDNQELFLTEAKCHGKYEKLKKYPYYGAAAKTIMKKELGDEKITEKLKNMLAKANVDPEYDDRIETKKR